MEPAPNRCFQVPTFALHIFIVVAFGSLFLQPVFSSVFIFFSQFGSKPLSLIFECTLYCASSVLDVDIYPCTSPSTRLHYDTKGGGPTLQRNYSALSPPASHNPAHPTSRSPLTDNTSQPIACDCLATLFSAVANHSSSCSSYNLIEPWRHHSRSRFVTHHNNGRLRASIPALAMCGRQNDQSDTNHRFRHVVRRHR